MPFDALTSAAPPTAHRVILEPAEAEAELSDLLKKETGDNFHLDRLVGFQHFKEVLITSEVNLLTPEIRLFPSDSDPRG